MSKEKIKFSQLSWPMKIAVGYAMFACIMFIGWTLVVFLGVIGALLL